MLHVKHQGHDLILRHVDASREVLDRLELYAEFLTEWNERINLVSASTLPHIWGRHFLDSAPLVNHIPKDAKTIIDIGSGAGFPGLVLSIFGIKNVHCIESTSKKVNFLRYVIEKICLDTVVH